MELRAHFTRPVMPAQALAVPLATGEPFGRAPTPGGSGREEGPLALSPLHSTGAATAGGAQAPHLGHDARVTIRGRWCASADRPRAGHARGPRGALACRR